MAVKPTLRKKEGTGGAYFSTPNTAIEFIPTGSKLLDCVLGGGWPLGRVVNIVGDKSTGKTLLAIEACANFARKWPNGSIWYNEAEAAFDLEYAQALGLPKKMLYLSTDCNTVEDFFEDLEKKLAESADSNAPGLYILDSLDALSDRAEMGREIDQGSYGAAKAKKMSELFRRCVRKIKTSNVCLIVISQVRDAIGVTFGVKYSRTGGRALDFYASQVVYLAQLGSNKRTIDKVQRSVGVKIRAKCTKNKVGLPRRECDFSILFGYGVDDIAASLEWLDSIGKLDEFERTNAARLPRFLAKLNDMPADELASVRAEVDALVIKHWYRIEGEFLPTRRKYA